MGLFQLGLFDVGPPVRTGALLVMLFFLLPNFPIPKRCNVPCMLDLRDGCSPSSSISPLDAALTSLPSLALLQFLPCVLGRLPSDPWELRSERKGMLK